MPQRTRTHSRTCSVEGCDRPRDSHGYCKAHCLRWKRHGDPLAGRNGPAFSTAESRFLSFVTVEISSGCWQWTGHCDSHGYGTFRDGKNILAHRWSFQHWRAPLDMSLEIDHMCHNRRCVNPSHLRQVDKSANQHNRLGANANSKTGVRGVYMKSGRFYAAFKFRKQRFNIGYFDTLEDATEAIESARQRICADGIYPAIRKVA